jgi:hypothetical protein
MSETRPVTEWVIRVAFLALAVTAVWAVFGDDLAILLGGRPGV